MAAVADFHPHGFGTSERQSGRVGHPQFGDPHELLHRDSVGRVDVGLGLPAGRDRAGQLTCGVGIGTTDPLHHLQELADEGNFVEGIARGWISVAHGGIVER